MGFGIGNILGGVLGAATGNWGLAAGSLLSGLGGSSAGQGTNPSQTQISEYLIPDDLKADYEGLLGASRSLFAKPFTEYTDPRIAGFSEDQLNAFQGIRDMQGKYQPLFDTASQLALQSATQYQNGITPEQIAQFMNPYQQNVIDISKRESIRDFDKQLMNLKGKQAASGAYGGTRGALMESELYRNTGQGLDDLQYRGMADSYTQALAAAFRNREGMAASSINLANLAGQGQSLGLKDLASLGAAGEAQQANQQAQYDFDYSEFGRKLAYEPERINQFNSFLQGWMPRKGVMSQNPGSPSPLAQALGYGSIFNGMGGLGGITGTISEGGAGGVFGGLGSLFGGLFGGGGGGSSATSGWGTGVWGGFPASFADGGMVKGKNCYALGGNVNYDDGLFSEPWSKGYKLFEPGRMSPLERIIASPFQKLGKAYDEFTGIGPALTKGVTKMFGNAGELGSSYMRGLRDLTTDRTDFEQKFYDAEPPMTDYEKSGLKPLPKKDEFGAGPLGDYIDFTGEDSNSTSDEQGLATNSMTIPEDSGLESISKEESKQNNRALIQLGIGLLATPGNFNFGLAKGMERYVEQLDKTDEFEMKKEAYAEAKRQNAFENQMSMKKLDYQMAELGAMIDNNQMKSAIDVMKSRKDAVEKRRDDITKIDDILTKYSMAETPDGHPNVVGLKERQRQLRAADLADKIRKGEISAPDAQREIDNMRRERQADEAALKSFMEMIKKED